MSFQDYQRSKAQQRRLVLRVGLGASAAVGVLAGGYFTFRPQAPEYDDLPLIEGTNFLRLTDSEDGEPFKGVTEFFQYGSVECFKAHQQLDRMRADVGASRWRRSPVLTDDLSRLHAKLFMVLDRLGIEDKLHASVFEAIHLRSNPLNSVDRIVELVTAKGYSKTAVQEMLEGASAAEFLASLPRRQSRHRVQAIPSLSVRSIYYTDVGLAGGVGQMMGVANQLYKK